MKVVTLVMGVPSPRLERSARVTIRTRVSGLGLGVRP
jgi:hypothetical protein